VWPEQYFELLWVTDAEEARANPLRLDRRAEWAATGASPIGLAFRGEIDSEEFWLYDALGPRIWIHADNERFPERPLVFVLEATAEAMQRRRSREAVAHRHPGALREVRVHGPSAPLLAPFAGPPVLHVPGSHGLELVVGAEGSARVVADGLVIRR
jgi:hypothetical protein